MNSTTCTIVKVGGSLLKRADLVERMQPWIRHQAPGRLVVVAGGGQLVEEIRGWQQQFGLDEKTAHWVCIDLLSITARLLHSRLPELQLTDDYEQLCSDQSYEGAVIFDPSRWLRDKEPMQRGEPLPETWEVTSDAIAGRLAIVSDATRLVVLKWDSPRSAASDLGELHAQGYIDRALAGMGEQLPVVEFVGIEDISA